MRQVFSVVKGVIKLPNGKGQLVKGQIVPEGAIAEDELMRLERYGIVKRDTITAPREPSREGQGPKVKTTEAAPPAPKNPVPVKRKWNRDPSSLEGLSLDELLIAVNEIDPTFDLSTLDEAGARSLLSSDFRPEFQEPVGQAAASDLEEAARRVANERREAVAPKEPESKGDEPAAQA